MNQYIVNFQVKIDETISVGVVGIGHLGNFHLKQLKGIPNISISGIYDSNAIRADEMSTYHDVISYSTLNDLINKSDAVLIVTPTSTHYSVADEALNAGCHLFIEKPLGPIHPPIIYFQFILMFRLIFL